MTQKFKVGLFVTCLVDLLRPNIGFATIKLLEQAGCEVVVPARQTCCGQPAYNSGDLLNTKVIASQVIEIFKDFDYVVVPSGSCAGMLRKHYPALFSKEAELLKKATHLAERTYELTAFLVDICKIENYGAHYPGTVTYHDACAGLRELGIKQQPRQLLANVAGCQLKELSGAEICCGFGGTFCVKYDEISNHIVSKKCADIKNTGVETVLTGDLGCLMNIAGKLQREQSSIQVYHIAEILANMTQHENH